MQFTFQDFLHKETSLYVWYAWMCCVVLCCVVLCCVALCCVVLCCVVLCCVVLCCVVWRRVASHPIVLYCVVSYRIASYCIVYCTIVSLPVMHVFSTCISLVPNDMSSLKFTYIYTCAILLSRCIWLGFPMDPTNVAKRLCWYGTLTKDVQNLMKYIKFVPNSLVY